MTKWLSGKMTNGEYALERKRLVEAHYRSLVARIHGGAPSQRRGIEQQRPLKRPRDRKGRYATTDNNALIGKLFAGEVDEDNYWLSREISADKLYHSFFRRAGLE